MTVCQITCMQHSVECPNVACTALRRTWEWEEDQSPLLEIVEADDLDGHVSESRLSTNGPITNSDAREAPTIFSGIYLTVCKGCCGLAEFGI